MDEQPGQFNEASEETWNQAPPPQAGKKPSHWAPLLDFVASGKIASVPVTDQKQLRGLRIGLARLAAGRQMKLEFRATDRELLVRRSDQAYQKVEPRAAGDTAPTPPNGRRRRGARKES